MRNSYHLHDDSTPFSRLNTSPIIMACMVTHLTIWLVETENASIRVKFNVIKFKT